jgi:hypothetical protein
LVLEVDMEALEILHAHLESRRDIEAPALLLRLMSRLKLVLG